MKKEELAKAKEVEKEVEFEIIQKEVVQEEIKSDGSVVIDINKASKVSSSIVTASNWKAKVEIANAMIDGGLVPSSFDSDPGAVISAVEMGLELGLGAWSSLTQIVIIKGKATLTLNAMLSLARSKGVLIKVLHDFELIPIEVKTKEGIKKATDRATTIIITRGEDIYSPSGKLLESRIGEYKYTKYWSEAKKAGLIEKENWIKMPRLMLRARAITEALRLYAADIILGMYESSEIS